MGQQSRREPRENANVLGQPGEAERGEGPDSRAAQAWLQRELGSRGVVGVPWLRSPCWLNPCRACDGVRGVGACFLLRSLL